VTTCCLEGEHAPGGSTTGRPSRSESVEALSLPPVAFPGKPPSRADLPCRRSPADGGSALGLPTPARFDSPDLLFWNTAFVLGPFFSGAALPAARAATFGFRPFSALVPAAGTAGRGGTAGAPAGGGSCAAVAFPCRAPWHSTPPRPSRLPRPPASGGATCAPPDRQRSIAGSSSPRARAWPWRRAAGPRLPPRSGIPGSRSPPPSDPCPRRASWRDLRNRRR